MNSNLKCTVLSTPPSTPSDDTSLWYIISAVCIAVVCIISAILFILKAERPEKFKDFTNSRYRLKIIGAFYDFGTHVLALIVIIQIVISIYSVPWQQIEFSSGDGVTQAFLINQNTVNCTSGDAGFGGTVIIGGQYCLVLSGLGDSFTFPINDFYPIGLLACSLICAAVTAIAKLNYSLYSKSTFKTFAVQCLSYSVTISAAYYVMAETDYCYGFNPIYTSEGGYFNEYSNLTFAMYAGCAISFISYVLLFLFSIYSCCCSSGEGRLNRFVWAILCFVVLAGLVFRIVTFLQGFDQLLNPTLLTNDFLFYFHTALSLLPVTALATDYIGIGRKRIRDDSSESSA